MRFVTARAATALAALSIIVPGAIVAAANRVDVRFTAPETFTDATYENRPASRDEVTRDLATILAKLGERYVPDGQQLALEVLDVDLAGRYEPWQQNGWDIRFMRDVTWPRIKFRYQLRDASGATIGSGEDQVNDMQYLTHPGAGFDSDRLRYEKVMLEDWFRKRFHPGARSSSR
ncbi:DUF3016 family protein [Panacagrimonas perspica]|uniref:DUF3016 family protein n=1 Tax=Panacagrimonas perspica TaxID=381431 RepID=A0A4S3JYM4_9GAMM|nr:DUF3016 domain-containing protein [Panacagrimonas perspica]TDU23341.1 DUF3016 family protein [Panacagrimonas perspica]THD00673.1 hypothetical protein B1810_23610 [Panacagrimonas perspica]